jgi:hypothetical protein
MVLLVTLLLALQQPAAGASVENPGVIRITVRDSETGTPIADAVVTLRGTSQPRKLTTDLDGLAVFEGLVPGRYTFIAQRDGYYGDTQPNLPGGMALAAATGLLELRAKAPDQPYVLRMVRGGSISGRVRRPDGKAVPNARLLAYVAGYNNGRPAFLGGPTTTTDKDGEYRLSSLGPGEYYLGVVRTGTPPSMVYYPGFVDFGRAASVSIRSHEDLDGVDVNLPETTGFHVSGKIIPLRETHELVNFTIVPVGIAGPGDSAPVIMNKVASTDGTFKIDGISAGAWDLYATFRTPDSLVPSGPRTRVLYMPSGWTRIDVVDRDLENVTIVENSRDVTGRIVVHQTSQGPQPSVTQLMLLPQQSVPGPLAAPLRNPVVLPTGDFTFYPVPAGTYSLSFQVPPGFYVSNLRLGPRSIYDSGSVDVGPDMPGPLEITLKDSGGTIIGNLEDNLPQRATERFLEPRIVLVPLSATQRDNVLLYKTSRLIGPPGRFTFRDVPPGDYKVFAWESVPSPDAERNPEFIARYEIFGSTVTVTEGENSSVRVQLIPLGR